MSSGKVVFGTYDDIVGCDADLMIVQVDKDTWWRGKLSSRLKKLVWASPNTKILLSFGGLDDDPRDIHEVPEVIAFCRDAVKHPAFVRRISTDSTGGVVCRTLIIAIAALPAVDASLFFDGVPRGTMRRFYMEPSEGGHVVMLGPA